MSRRFVFAVPGDLSTPTGGYTYDRRIIAELRALGWEVDALNIGDGFPRPSPQTYDLAEKKLVASATGIPIVVDGLALGVLPELAAALSRRNPLVGLVHHPLALENGLAADQAEAFKQSERASLSQAAHVVTPSKATAQILALDYAVPPSRITVVLPGTDPAPAARGSSDGIVRLLSVGAIVPRKGYDVLLAALATMPELPWQLTIAGPRERDIGTAERLDADIDRLNFRNRIHVIGAVSPERLNALYHDADVFVLASRFEGYGMAYADAIGHGLPVIGTTAGAIPEAVPKGAGVLVAPDDADALAQALRPLIERENERRHLAAAASAAAQRLPIWQSSAKRFAQVLERLL